MNIQRGDIIPISQFAWLKTLPIMFIILIINSLRYIFVAALSRSPFPITHMYRNITISTVDIKLQLVASLTILERKNNSSYTQRIFVRAK